MKLALAWLAALTLTLGCSEPRSERLAASYSSATKPAVQPPPAQKPSPTERSLVGLDSIPVEESYEERAASTITEANLQAQVTEIEKELTR